MIDKPRVLVACEYSGRVREALAANGCDAWSCDLIPSKIPGQHIIADVLTILNDGWDMMIAFPPCTYLSYAGNRWLNQPGRTEKRDAAVEFFKALLNASIPCVAIENPVGYSWKFIRRPDQIIEPYEFGDPFTKKTCLWLKNAPPLLATLICADPFVNWTKYKGSHNGHARSVTFAGIAAAMGKQWGSYICKERVAATSGANGAGS